MTYLIGFGTIVLQIVLAVHAVRSKRPLVWIFIILIFPLMGSLIYIIAELIPEWEKNNTIQKWINDIQRFVSEIFTHRE
jgi:hypothetical protein